MIDVPVSTVIELALKSTLFPAVAFLLVLGLARRPAAERHVEWSAVIVGLLALPFLQGLLPGFKVLPRLDAFAAPARRPRSAVSRPSQIPHRAVSSRTAGRASGSAERSACSNRPPSKRRGPSGSSGP